MAATRDEENEKFGRSRKRPDALRRTEMRRNGREALSIGRFIKARQSTYDKREKIKQNRAEGAARKARYERLQKKLGTKIEREEGFDPEAYERRLAAIDDPTLGVGAGPSGRGRTDGDARAATRDADDEDDDDDAPEEQRGGSEKKKKKMKMSVYEKQQAAREQRDAYRKAFLETKEKLDETLREQLDKRQNKKNLMRKKNKRGQPVMKHRVQSILDKLSSEIGSS